MCAMTSKSYDWDLRNKVKISPKMTKKRPILDFFDVIILFYGLKELSWSLSTLYKGLICAIPSESYDWDPSESEGKRPNPTPLPHMRFLFNFYSNFSSVVDISLRPGVGEIVFLFVN